MFIRSLLLLFSFFFLTTVTASAEQKELSLAYVYTGDPALAYPENSEDKGILIDIAHEIGKRSGIIFKTQRQFEVFIAGEMQDKKLDAAIAGTYRSEQKDGNFIYSDSFLDDKVINSYRAKGLKRKKFEGAGDPITGFVAGTYNVLERTFNDDYNADCENVESGKVEFKDLRGNPPTDPCDRGKSYIGLNILRSGYFDHIFHKGVREIDFTLVLQKGYEDFLPSINNAIAEMKKDGTIDRIFEGYLAKAKSKGILHGE